MQAQSANFDPALLHGDGTFESYAAPAYPHSSAAATAAAAMQLPPPSHALPERRQVTIDVGEFVRTRDALSSAYMSLSASIDRAVKSYIDHTNVVLAGDSTLNVSYLTQPFDQLAHTAQIAQQAMLQGLQLANGAPKSENVDEKGKRKKRKYTPRDPNMPKRPLTAYFRYLQEVRGPLAEELKQRANGQPQKPGELSKEATLRWKAMPDDRRQPYRDAYKAALVDWAQKCLLFKQAGGKLDADAERAVAKAATGADVVDAGGEEEEEEEGIEEDLVAANAMHKPGEDEDEDDDDDEDEDEDDEDDDDDDDDDDDEDEEEEEEAKPAPPPPPPQPTKSAPKSALKKGKQQAAPVTPKFSSINPSGPAPAPVSTSSPERKRKAPATPTVPNAAAVEAPAPAEAEPPAKKKRGRKSQQTAEPPAPAPAQASAPASAPAAQTAVDVADGGAKKKRKKKVDAT